MVDQMSTAAGVAPKDPRVERRPLRLLLLSALFCGMTVIGAHLRLPLPYVPLTLQTFFVLLSGMLLGPLYGPLSQAGYVLLGLAGLPVFAQGGGLGYVLKPTFGYLLGYPLGSGLIGRMLHGREFDGTLRQASTRRLVLAGGLGLLAIFLTGVSVLYLNLNLLSGASISWSAALWSGCIVFLPGDAVKLAGAVLVYRGLVRFMATRRLPLQPS